MADLNTALSPAPVVQCLTTGGDVAVGYTSNVTVSLASNPTGATLGGTLVVAASSGVATFSDLTLNRSGKGFTLRATGPAAKTRVSAPFDIATRCVFTTQPSTVEADEIFTCVVTVRDGGANTDVGYNGVVTLSLYQNSAGGTLSGTLTRTAINGVATFPGLSLNLDGTYSIFASASEVATAYPPSGAVTSTITVADGYTLTAVDLGSDTYGKTVSDGSISPASYLGSIRTLTCQFFDPDYRLVFSMSGGYTQDAFTSITVNGFTFLTSAADDFSNFNTWEWDTSSNVIPSAGSYVVSFVD
jgi:hypothetical protein